MNHQFQSGTWWLGWGQIVISAAKKWPVSVTRNELLSVSKSTLLRCCMASFLFALLYTTPIHAESQQQLSNRYQSVASWICKTQVSVLVEALILDSIDGHLYLWSQIHGSNADGIFLNYQGRLVPKSNPNDSIDKYWKEVPGADATIGSCGKITDNSK